MKRIYILLFKIIILSFLLLIIPNGCGSTRNYQQKKSLMLLKPHEQKRNSEYNSPRNIHKKKSTHRKFKNRR